MFLLVSYWLMYSIDFYAYSKSPMPLDQILGRWRLSESDDMNPYLQKMGICFSSLEKQTTRFLSRPPLSPPLPSFLITKMLVASRQVWVGCSGSWFRARSRIRSGLHSSATRPDSPRSSPSRRSLRWRRAKWSSRSERSSMSTGWTAPVFAYDYVSSAYSYHFLRIIRGNTIQ